ncbi:hypothetical protein MLD38_030332 [Melastoma candidum]|uniref:Uncharacterized protein n=1 Tax=Melastoma candidum TaxID=119954 RepID=A0ACB9MMJ2_9MYRT|nr:hypothetical protein MLD38_030332 [Melastoma candidum]
MKGPSDDACGGSRHATTTGSPLDAKPGLAAMLRWEIPKDRVKFAVLCLLLIGAVYTFLCWMPAESPVQLPPPDETVKWGDYSDELGKVLTEAATEDKYVVVTVLNKAYVEGDKPMLDIFLDALWLGEGTHRLVKHLLVVVLDSTSMERCRFLRLHCYHLEIEGGGSLEGEKLFLSEDFLRIMWRRILLLRDILARGYSLVFTDTDVLWLRDPFPKFDPNPRVDFQISADRFKGNPWSVKNPINAGFYMVRSNNRTVALFQEWHNQRNRTVGTSLHEQDMLVQMLRGGVFGRLGVKFRILDTTRFSSFCQNSKDVKQVATVHANCCKTIRAKVTDLTKAIADWKRFKSNPNERFSWSRHEACEESWHR